MSLLLDTHTFLWFILDDPRLTSTAIAAIDSEPDEVFVSPASYWETAIKIGLGKYPLKAPFETFWDRGIVNSGFAILPIRIRHAARVIQLPLIHRDPFDRLLVAQALVENLTLVSNDVILDRYSVRRVW